MRHRRIGCRLSCVALTLLLARAALMAGGDAPPDLDAWVARAIQTFEVPGIGLAIVKDGAVVTAKGYGVRKLGEPAPVDARTLFGIASNTKIFTATALGLLVDEGKVEWDAPVIRYLPAFAMWDPYVTREMTVRDLLVHRSGLGLGAGDLLWWPASTYDRAEIAHRLRFIPPATSFRSAYAYDNVLYLVAGRVIEAVSGQSWEDFVSSRILATVGMRDGNDRHSAAGADGNVATTHARVDGKVRPIAPFVSDTVNPAGGINASAEDMAKWLRVQVSGGMLADGSRLFSAATARQLTRLVTPIPFGDPPRELAPLKGNFNGYALGLGVRDYRGHKILTHTGGLPGYVSRVVMVPDIGLGVAVLTNQESTGAFDAIAYHIVDHFLAAPAFDWIAGYKAVEDRSAAQNAEAVAHASTARDAASAPSLPLAQYAGMYRDQWYGDVMIAVEHGNLAIHFSHSPGLSGPLQHWQHDTFIAHWNDRELRADAYVAFALNPDGTIDQVKMRPVSPATDFSFDFQDLLLKPVRTK
ncbi:MAG TPA: serine hydrolase [Vicinamibacterales bacterium]|jgi:CubicO group peptidase (beta-lactamase class C family)|nr:serine hydrolase [Vicinamibacterales bacterium]